MGRPDKPGDDDFFYSTHPKTLSPQTESVRQSKAGFSRAFGRREISVAILCETQRDARGGKTVAWVGMQLWGFTGNGGWTDSVQGARENYLRLRLSTDEFCLGAGNAGDFRCGVFDRLVYAMQRTIFSCCAKK
jgi:hypothetical protein